MLECHSPGFRKYKGQDMKILNSRIFKVSLSFRKSFTIAGGTTTVAEHVFI